MHLEDGWRSYMAAAVKEKFADKVVMTTGNIRDPKVAEQILEEGRADLIGMGRGLIADPEWVNKVQSGKNQRYVNVFHVTSDVLDIVLP